jgi:hypothetical protein
VICSKTCYLVSGLMHRFTAQQTRIDRTPSRAIDIWHEVPLVPQQTGMSCWAAAAAMLVGWRDCSNGQPDTIAQGAGHWRAYQYGLDPQSIVSLTQKWRLFPLDYQVLTPDRLRRALYELGPLWVGEATPGLHSVVITGIYGDGSPEGTFVRINDPWPIGQGERYSKSMAALTRDLRAATEKVGQHMQVLHSGGRRPTPIPVEPTALSDPTGHADPLLNYGGRDLVLHDPEIIPAGHFLIMPGALQTLDGLLQPLGFRWSKLPKTYPVLDLVIVETTPWRGAGVIQNQRYLLRVTDKIIHQAAFPSFLIGCIVDSNQADRERITGHDPSLQNLIFKSLDWLMRNIIGATAAHTPSLRGISRMQIGDGRIKLTSLIPIGA